MRLRSYFGVATLFGIAALSTLIPNAAAAERLQQARDLRLHGRYEEALDVFEQLRVELPVEAALGMASCYAETGRVDLARQTLEEVAKPVAGTDRVLAKRAQLELQRGQHEAAQQLVDECREIAPRNVLAQWVQAELHRRAGDLKQARAGYSQLVDQYNAAARVASAHDVRVYGWAASQMARWDRNSQDFRLLVNDLLPSALKLEAAYWPAHLDAAMLYLEKYNRPAAQAELEKARGINPNSADILAGVALLNLQAMEFETAERSIERALSVNPRHARALQLRADLLFASFRPQEALTVVQSLLQENPRDEATLGRQAAAFGLLDGVQVGEPKRMQQVVAEVRSLNPLCGVFFETLGDVFDLARKYPVAATYYEQAAEAMPQLMSVHGKLGMMLMRLGEEGRAAQILEDSFQMDPFNVRVKNTLEVLDLLSGYAVLETEHFILKFDRGQEQLLAEHAADYLEEHVYPEITESLGFEPTEKSLFEIFSRGKNSSGHAWFSARMVGLPSIGTVGACAGKVVALASPHEMAQPFNWARVLKHEFVHVVNLQQTHFNIPHWYTEALAVWHERQPRPALWNEILARRTRAKQLYTLDTINLAFARPRNAENWTLAYCQAELYAEFMLAKYGEDALEKMLAAYADNLSTKAAVQRCFGVDPPMFEAGYLEYVEGVVAELPQGDQRAAASFAELHRRTQERPESPIAWAQLARAQLDRGSKVKARQSALRSLRLEPKQQLAAYVLARLYLSIGDTRRAVKLLDESLDREAPQEDVLALLAGLYLRAESYGKAEQLYQLGYATWPGQLRWLKALAKLHLVAGQQESLAEVLKELVSYDGDNAAITSKLARLAFDAGKFGEAAKWANQSLFVNVHDAETHALLGQARLEQEQFDPAVRSFQTALRLESNRHAWRLMLADAMIQGKRPEEAKKVLADLLERAPDFPGANELLESIDSE